MVSMIPNPHTQIQPPPILNTTQRDQPDQRDQDPHSQRTERDSERGEGNSVNQDERRPNPTKKGNQTPHSQWTERDSGKTVRVIEGRVRDERRPNPTKKGTRFPTITTDREGFREGRG